METLRGLYPFCSTKIGGTPTKIRGVATPQKFGVPKTFGGNHPHG